MYCTNILNLSKVQAYNPRLQQWSVEEPLTNPKHKACAVAIDNSLVITGGTMLGKKKSILITYILQGDPNQNLLFQLALSLNVGIPDPMLVKPKCVWELEILCVKS